MSQRSAARGVTLIDTLIASSLMLIIFLGIFAAFQLSVDVVLNNKARAGAIALADERMEYIRSLTYSQVGTIGGIPAGIIPQIEQISLNGISYTRRTFIQYADDPGDGLGAADTNGITADYKVLRSDVYWTSRTGERHITVLSRMSPGGSGIESAVPGGTLTLQVVNATAQPVFNAQIHIVNSSTTPTTQNIDFNTYTNTNGFASFIGATSTGKYQITVTKSGYSSSQTYSATTQNASPNPGHLTVSANQTTSGTFAIDVLSQKTISTWTPVLPGTWTDTFVDGSNIAVSASTTVSGGAVLLSGSAPYPTNGSIQSVSITPAYLASWKTLSWSASLPAGTGILYRVYDGSGSTLIPESQIPGNGAGFTTSPIILTGISTSTYQSIRVGAQFTSTGSGTPSIDAWNVDYDYGPQPLPAVSFTLKGAKAIGSGSAGTIYKYSTTQNSGAAASVTLTNMEWDTYELAPSGTTYDIASACHPQSESATYLASSTKFSLAPNTQTVSSIYFVVHTINAVAVDVHSTASGALIPYANVRLYKTGYDTTQTADSCGQTMFSGLSAGNYTLVVSASSFATSTTAVTVGGTTRSSVSLN
jgi:hypothetical protein